MSIPTRITPERLALVAFVCLLIVAAALRFYNLSADSVEYDEAVAANNSAGALREVLPNTRHFNSAPIIYPVALWAVQKVAASAFSIRLLPAAASVLTVAVLLFVLPRLGVSRWAALLAALLATLSIAAIEHAQDAREYSVDALLAVLIIAALLWYLRDGRKAPLCAALFIAPLLQYNLVMFGVAAMGAAILLSPATLAGPQPDSHLSRIRNRLRQRIPLVWPAAGFLAGCVATAALTLPYHWGNYSWGRDGYLSPYYYQGNFHIFSIFEFAIGRIWSLLTHHLSETIAIATLATFAILLVAVSLRKIQITIQDRAIAVLFLLCITIAIAAAVLGVYPVGKARNGIYLGPIVFLTAGVAIHLLVDRLAVRLRRAWLIPALAVLAAGAIAFAGVSDLRQNSPYSTQQNIKSVLAFLDEQAAAGDLVYVMQHAVLPIQFYQDERPGNYYYGAASCPTYFSQCSPELVSLLAALPNIPNSIFVVHGWNSIGKELQLDGTPVPVEHVITDGHYHVALIDNFADSFQPAHALPVSAEPAVRSHFDLHLSKNTLLYAKEPCAPADMEGVFFLHLIPDDIAALPNHRQQYGYDNLDFNHGGITVDGRCLIVAPLPEYDIARIRTGQYAPGQGLAWEVEFPFDAPE